MLGKPVAHSLSPVLHNAAYRALRLADWSYGAIECDEQGLAAVLSQADDSWRGFSCTMPVKEAALAAAATRSLRAEVVGAANTLTRVPDGSWHADNTDIAGIVAAVGERAPIPARVVILGAGGTARAALAAVAHWGLTRVDVVVRNPARADAAVRAAARLGVAVEIHDLADPSSGEVAAAADLVISTLPPRAADSLIGWPWRSSQAVLDVVYMPWPTALADAAARAGATIVTGAAMLLHQAADQVHLMTGLEPPVEAMRAALAEVVPPGTL